MGLRDRKSSRVRDRDLRIGRSDGGRILLGRAAASIHTFGAYLIRRMKQISMPDMTQEEEVAADGTEHFAETMLGGIAITFGLLVAIMILLWIGTFL